MSQDTGDPVVPPGSNGTRSFFALSDAIGAIRSAHSGATEPTATVPYMLWADTAAGLMKMRDAADGDWIVMWSLSGGVGKARTQKTADFTVDRSGVYFVSDAAGSVIVTLPPIASAAGWEVWIKKTNSSANTITITPDGSETIETASTVVLSAQFDQSILSPSTVEWLAFG